MICELDQLTRFLSMEVPSPCDSQDDLKVLQAQHEADLN